MYIVLDVENTYLLPTLVRFPAEYISTCQQCYRHRTGTPGHTPSLKRGNTSKRH